jgi:hypothetical protein
MNSQPKLIDNKQVRTEDLREFLGKEFPKDSLPGVDEARAAGHRAVMELFRTNEQRAAQEAGRRIGARRCNASSRTATRRWNRMRRRWRRDGGANGISTGVDRNAPQTPAF